MSDSKKGRSILFHIVPILGLLLLILLFLNRLAFSNLILARGDTFLYFYPYWHAAAEAFSAWRVPLWNPAIFMGAPLLANSQMGFFYPPNWPFWLLFETPYAASGAILLHIFIASTGAFLVGRRVLLLAGSSAFLTAFVFGLSGYLTAQVEHINQLQGLAWLPWMLLIVGRIDGKTRRQWIFSMFGVAFLFSLQLLAGHTQTAFISGAALVIWIIAWYFSGWQLGKQDETVSWQSPRNLLAALALLVVGGLLAFLLTAVQLLPTLELTSLSSRQGGLPVNEVLSFSLNPLLMTRALLPAYGQSIFSEYAAFLPISVLALAFIGAWQWRKREGVLPALVWIAAGLLLALGAFNPLNWFLAQLPGFNLFRAPARWLVIYSFGTAMLAGTGWQVLRSHFLARKVEEGEVQDAEHLKNEIGQPLLLTLIIILLLAVWGYAAALLINIIPTGAEAPYEAPSTITLLFWIVEIILMTLLCWLLIRWRGSKKARFPLAMLMGLIIMVLFLSTRTLPYNDPTTPEAYFDLRSSTTRLLFETADPPERLLSLSDIFFDPGDQAEIDSIYADQLSPSAQYDYTIAVKQKEVLSPNLPMIYGLSSVDGFDGGVLPLRSYSEFVQLILPEGKTTTDGRLREHLEAVPDARWLDHFNAKYLITDKVGDIWHDGVFYDRQHPQQMGEGETIEIGYLPDFEATELRILASDKPGIVQAGTRDDQNWEFEPALVDQGLYQVGFPTPASLQQLTIGACPEVKNCELQALTLVDERDGAFQSLVPGSYRMIHSGDVKIYENLDVLPRAYMISDWEWETESEVALNALQLPEFDPRQTAILLPHGDILPQPSGTDGIFSTTSAQITRYLPEQIVINTNETGEGMLILTDANYPGWEASIDGQPTPIYQANILYRAVHVPAGPHEIVFSFEPRSYRIGLLVTLASLGIVTIILGGLLLRRRRKSL